MAIGQDLLNVPMGDMIRQMAFAIADAQFELDDSSFRVAEMMSGQVTLRNEDGSVQMEGTGSSAKPVTKETTVKFGGEDLSMMELGFTPNFYQFVDTIIEVKIAIKISTSTENTRVTKGTITRVDSTRRGWLFAPVAQTVVTTTPVDATYTSKYNYSAEGSSLLRTKLVPVPPPSILQERIRALMEAKQKAVTP